MPQYILRILGPVELTRHDGVPVHSVLNQAKRTALLAYLATAPSGTRTRAEIIELFWSDKTEEEGRHALSQALYFLRRSLGKSALIVEGETLGLDPDVVDTDVIRFRDHIQSDRLQDAVTLYRADLLHPFPSVPGFDHWLDGARESLRRQVLVALDRLWLAAREAGDHDLAIQWAERAHELAPYHEAPVRRLLSSLLADSQPVRAREVFERYAAQLRDELDMEPSPETGAMLDSPTATSTVERAGAPSTRAAAEAHPDADALEPSAAAAPPTGAHRSAPDRSASHHASPDPSARGAVRPSRRWAVRGILSIAVLAVGYIGAVDHTSRAGSATVAAEDRPETRVGIFPFVYRGHPELAYLGDGIAELINISLHSLDHVSTLDPRALAAWPGSRANPMLPAAEAAEWARGLGADRFIVGTVVEAGGQIHVTARMHGTDGAQLSAVSGRAPGEESLFALIDDLVRQLIASDAFPGASDLERAAALTTGSLAALRHFMRGEQLFREGHYGEAEFAFDQAVREDSAFALAHYRGAVASIWQNDADFDAARHKVSRALELSDHVSGLEADLFLALHEFLRGRLVPAEQLYQSVLRRQPENIEAWFQLAETRFHYGGLHGRGIESSEESWRHVVILNPEHHAALIHLAALAAVHNDPALDSLEARINRDGDAIVYMPQVRALRVFSSGTEADRIRYIDQLRRHPSRAIAVAAAYASRYLRDPGAGARIALILTEASRPPSDRVTGHLLLAHFELARGRRREARIHLDHAQRLDSLRAEPHRLLLATLPSAPVALRSAGGDDFDAVPRLDVGTRALDFVAFDGSSDAALRVYARTLAYHHAGGEDGALLATARQLDDAAGSDPDATRPDAHAAMSRALARGLLAERHLAHGDSSDARSELRLSLHEIERWYEHLRTSYLRSLARERFLLAEAELAAGRDSVAESILHAFGDNSVAELPYLAPSLVRIGEIRERAGDTEGAAEAYRRALSLWADAEPELDPLLRELKYRVETLSQRR